MQQSIYASTTWTRTLNDLLIRHEQHYDFDDVHRILSSAFKTHYEANLVHLLRIKCDSYISLVAEKDSKILGHIMFTPVSINNRTELKIMGLAPLSVHPDSQRKGVGSALIKAGLERCAELGYGAVVLLGHVNYYPRFGFKKASTFGLKCEYDAPEEAFMAIELKEGHLDEIDGTVRFHDAFVEKISDFKYLVRFS